MELTMKQFYEIKNAFKRNHDEKKDVFWCTIYNEVDECILPIEDGYEHEHNVCTEAADKGLTIPSDCEYIEIVKTRIMRTAEEVIKWLLDYKTKHPDFVAKDISEDNLKEFFDNIRDTGNDVLTFSMSEGMFFKRLLREGVK